MDAAGIAQPALVTGATGFIGRALIARLLRHGVRVRALVLPGEPIEGVLPEDVDIVRGDVTDPDAVSEAMRGAGTVFHLAAVVGDWGDEDLFQRITVGGTRNVMNAAAENNVRVLLASSVVVYGDFVHTSVCEEDLGYGKALGPYSRAKQQQERLALEMARTRGVRLTVIRPTNVYGPGSRPWVHDVVDQIRTGTPSLIGGGEHNAGLVHVENVVDVFTLAACRDGAVGRIYNAGEGSAVTWKQYFSDIARLIGAKPPTSIPWIVAMPAAHACEAVWKLLGLKHRPPLTLEALNLVGSDHRVPIDRARLELGYVPGVDYATGIRTVADYIKQAKLA